MTYARTATLRLLASLPLIAFAACGSASSSPRSVGGVEALAAPSPGAVGAVDREAPKGAAAALPPGRIVLAAAPTPGQVVLARIGGGPGESIESLDAADVDARVAALAGYSVTDRRTDLFVLGDTSLWIAAHDFAFLPQNQAIASFLSGLVAGARVTEEDGRIELASPSEARWFYGDERTQILAAKPALLARFAIAWQTATAAN